MLKSKRTWLVALAIVLTVLANLSIFVPKADACWAYGVTRYYSDPCYTNLVGERAVYCNCTLSQWGTTTSYSVFTSFDCSGDLEP